MRRRFTIPSLILLLVTFGLIGFFLVNAGTSSSQTVLIELQGQMLRLTSDQLSKRLEEAEHINRTHADVFQGGILDIESQAERERYFSGFLRAYPEVAMTFVALPDGSFYGARRTAGGEVQVVRNDSTTGGDSRYYETDGSGEGTELAEVFESFDARTRPWYTKAAKESAPVFSDVYSHFVFNEPTITASHPIYGENGELVAVFGVDYLLSWLGETLGSLPVGASGQVFITDGSGTLIAAPQKGAEPGALSLLPALECGEPLICRAAELGEEEFGKSLPGFVLDGERFFVGREGYDLHGLDWNLFVVSAEGDFLGGMKRATTHTVLILAASLLASAAITTWIGRRMTRPVAELCRAANELARGNRTFIPGDRKDELGDLTRAFNEMSLQLTDMVAHLEDEVAARTRELEARNGELSAQNELSETFRDADEGFVYLKDKDLKYVFLNRALREYYALPAEDILGRDDFEILDSDFAGLKTQADRAVLERGELTVASLSWGGRFFRSTKFPVKMPDGSVGVGAYIADITEEHGQQQRRDRALRSTELLLELLTRAFKTTKEQIEYALAGLLELSGSSAGYLYLYDEEKREFTLGSWVKSKGEKGAGVAPQVVALDETGALGSVISRREPLILNSHSSPDTPWMRRFMSVPIIVEDKIVAVIGFANKEEEYDETDVSEMTVLMSGVLNAVQRRESAETLAYERNKYLQTLLSIGDGVMVIDKDQNIEMLNRVACSLTGWTAEEAAGAPYREVFALSHEQKGFSIDDPVEKVFLSGETQELGNHAMLTSKDGRQFHLEDSAAPVRDEQGALAGVVLVFRDVTEKKEQRKKIEYISFHDSMTGLYNRRFFEEELRRIDTERNLPISILMGDVNSLKLTNDIFGHAFGDMLLERVAEVMKNVCRADDIIARWGGDEFVILLPRTTPEEAERISNRIKKGISAQRIRAIRGSISLGWDTKHRPGEDIARVLSNAEARMYTVKLLERDETLSHELDNITAALFDKNEEEKGHALRVSELSCRLGRAAGLLEADMQTLADAGRVHDIGKIALDPELLENRGELTPEEQNEVEQHPAVGYRILNSFVDTMKLAEIVLAHHENWDGSGYPKGLSGESIPLLARIISIAESYDRAVHTRGKTPEQALLELGRGAGARFDPGLAEAFISMLEQEGGTRPE